MTRLLFKVVVFSVLFLGATAAIGRAVYPRFACYFQPRHRIFYQRDFNRYDAALLGTSVFTSGFVDREDQMLWHLLDSQSGLRTFPGATNGARAADMVASARYVAERLPPAALVFVEVHPLNAWRPMDARFKGRLLAGGFLYDDAGPVERAWNVVAQPIFADFFRLRELFFNLQLRNEPTSSVCRVSSGRKT